MRHLQSLPEELLLHILSFLEPHQVADLQSVSRFLLRICRDKSVWRNRCLSAHVEKKLSKLGLSNADVDAATTDDLSTLPGNISRWHLAGRSSLHSSKENRKEHLRLLANWDPSFPDEEPNWYREYIHRHAPISVSWFQRPGLANGTPGAFRDIRGCALYRSPSTGDQIRAVAPLDDGTICLWDVNGSDDGIKGGIVAESSTGLLYSSQTSTAHSRKGMGVDPVECVSVDSITDRAYFAIQNRLVEIDLGTLKVVGEHAFEWGIHALSSIQPSVPLTVGTHLGIHLFDHRSPTTMPAYAPLMQPGPISINHMEKPGAKLDVLDDIFVAGRFSSILHYDRRMFPNIKGSIHSGANICSLASLPHPFSWLNSELRRDFQLSEEEAQQSKTGSGTTLVACGEYKTKGSLELYGISEPKSPGGTPIVRTFQTSTLKNRQTASSAKLLSVVNHGTRLVYSDGQGYLKWMERDGFTEVRNHKLGNSEKFVQNSLFRSMPGSDEMALKLLSTQTATDESDGISDDILFWTGEKLGLVGFSSKPGCYADDFEANSKTPEELEQQEEENSYRDRMREALRQQAVNAHFVQNLGAGLGTSI